MSVFDDALKARFAESTEAVAVTSLDTLLIYDVETDTILKLPVSVLTNAINAAAPVQSVAGKTGTVTLNKSDVGLSNVDNTSDANKPVSTAQATAIATKEPTIAAGTTAQYWRGDKSWQTLNKAAVGLSNVENTALSTWAGSTNLTTLGTLINALRLNNSFAIWDTATGAAAGKDLTWRMNVAGGNPVSVLGRLKPSSYTAFRGVTQNVVYLYVGAWNNNDDAGTPVATFGSTGDVEFKGRVYAPNMSLLSLSTYADNAAATAGGLAVGTLYKTSAGDLKIVV